jgi:hypothetical protein
MKRVYIVSISLVLALFFLAPLAAFDWGGAVTNISGYASGNDGEFSQSDKVSLWFSEESELSAGSLSFAAQGSYLFTDDRPYLFDLDVLKGSATFAGLLGSASLVDISLGRFTFADPTGYILYHTADGASLKVHFSRLKIEIDGAYTGLLFNPSSDIRISDLDFSEQSDEENNYFGPQRLLSQGKISFSGSGLIQNWQLFGLAQFDLREDDAVGEVVNSQYWGSLLSFRLGQNLYHDAFLTLGTAQFTGASDSTALSLLTGFSWRFLKEEWLGSRLSVSGLIATPDIPTAALDAIGLGFNIGKFRPLNSPSLGMVVDPTLDALLYAGADYSLRPFMNGASGVLSRIQPSIGARAYFRPVVTLDSQTYKWAGEWADQDAASDSWFLGTEYNAGVAWRIFSDFSTGLTAGVFMPGEAWSKAAEPEYMVRFELSASF